MLTKIPLENSSEFSQHSSHLSEMRLLKLLSVRWPGPNHRLARLSGTWLALSRRITFRTSGSVLWKRKG